MTPHIESLPAARAMSDSLRSLDEIRYALDQAAIVAATDHQGRITYVNDKFCQISQYSRAELIGQDHRIVNSGYHPKAFMQDLWRTIARGQVWRGEIRNRAKDGSIYWVDTTIVPFLDGSGRPRQYLAVRYDITARKDAETRLREQAALAQLGQLAAVFAHEVRNPLAGLRASLQVIDGRCDARDRSAIAAMIQRIDGLNDKLTDILLYARPRPAVRVTVDVNKMLRDVAASAETSMGRVPGSIPVSGEDVKAIADPDMLRAALLNLTLNACQTAPDTHVELRVSADYGACRIAVCDRGPGIIPDIRDRIFEPFFTTRVSGTGLGLAIVKRLMDLQDGTVRVDDREGGGTIAEVTVPRAAA
ncbi:MAG TPA: ATP-binding protein [Vicinamibacterales bacterium]|nr:ATP-binding protein [Vicinamibacterales bacterium]